MEQKKLFEAIKKLREVSTKRNFIQSIDLVFSLKGIDTKKPGDKISVMVFMPKGKGKKPKICALVDKSLHSDAKKIFDRVILQDDFSNINSKEAEKIVDEYDYFVAQANIMSDIATTFGKFLGPKGKMPDPKAGLIITPKSNLEEIKSKLEKFVRLRIKKSPTFSCVVGLESMSDEDLAENIMSVYNSVEKALPRGSQQINKVIIKTTMGNPVVI